MKDNVIELTFAPKQPGEETDAEFLRDLADKLNNVAPNVLGTDQYHVERLRDIAGVLVETCGS